MTKVAAVIFDYYFTLAQPALTDFTAIARTLGSSTVGADVEHARQKFLGSRATPTPVFDGTPPPFRPYRAEWVAVGDAIFAQLELTGGGVRYAAHRARAHREAALYPDARAAIQGLRDAGLSVAVLSDADRGYLHANIAHHDLTFDAVVCSEDLCCYKPHRQCFVAVCNQLGVEPSETHFVGDSPIADIEGSRRAGLLPVWINRRGLDWPDAYEAPDVAIDTLHELVSLLA